MKVKLTKAVDINHKTHKAGDVVELTDGNANWLIGIGAAEKHADNSSKTKGKKG